MSSLKKKRKTWFIRFQRNINGKTYEIAKSLQTHNKAVAIQRQREIDEKIKYDDMDPFTSDFEINFEKPKPQILFVQETVELFLKSRESYSPRTHRYYSELLNHFVRISKTKKKFITQVSKKDILTYLMRDGIKNVSRHSMKKGLRTWWRWCMENEYVEKDIIKAIELPAPEIQYYPKMLSEKELKTLFNAFDRHIKEKKEAKNFSPWQTQDWFKAAIATMFYTGIRRREIGKLWDVEGSGLKGENIIGDLEFIYIGKSKTPKERMIPISKKLRPYLRDYFKIRGWPDREEYVFINYRNQPVSGKNMWRQFKIYCKIAGIPATRTLHGMRHRCITSWLEKGFTLSEARDMAGHTNIEITDSVYTHLAAKNLKRKMDKLESNEGD
ncbi:MAG TPA: tyrosine-type recombinase/integrase [Bacteroidales bacterium]|nr:tyrosine-type recombinase/integrase [Bacteroidales bacterium]